MTMQGWLETMMCPGDDLMDAVYKALRDTDGFTYTIHFCSLLNILFTKQL